MICGTGALDRVAQIPARVPFGLGSREYYDPMRDEPATRVQRELGFDLIGLSAPMRIVTNAYKT